MRDVHARCEAAVEATARPHSTAPQPALKRSGAGRMTRKSGLSPTCAGMPFAMGRGGTASASASALAARSGRCGAERDLQRLRITLARRRRRAGGRGVGVRRRSGAASGRVTCRRPASERRREKGAIADAAWEACARHRAWVTVRVRLSLASKSVSCHGLPEAVTQHAAARLSQALACACRCRSGVESGAAKVKTKKIDVARAAFFFCHVSLGSDECNGELSDPYKRLALV